MNTRRLFRHLLLLSICLLTQLILQSSSISQVQTPKQTERWEQNLYQMNVQYETFACREEDSEVVRNYFASRPLSIKQPICHNDCPVVECRPVVPFPATAKTVRVTGKVSVHV